MAENNFDDEIKSLLNDASRESSRYGGALGNSSRANTILVQATQQEILSKRQEILISKLRRQSLNQLGGAMVSMTTTLSSSGSSFAPVTTAIKAIGKAANQFASSFGSVGKVLGSVAEGMSDTVTHIIDTFEKNYGNFEKLSETGVVDTFDNLRVISQHSMLTMSTLSTIMDKNSKNMALYGKTAVNGGQEFKKFASATRINREKYMTLGFSIEAYAESQANYMTFMARMGTVEQNDMNAVQMRHSEYLNHIIELSAQTGISRTELQNRLNDLTRDARFQAWASSQDEESVKRANKLIQTFSLVSKDLAKGIQDTIAAGGGIAANSEEFMSLLRTFTSGNEDLIESTKQYVNGVMSYDDYLKTSKRALAESSKTFKEIVPRAGDIKGFVSYADLATFKQLEPLNDEQLRLKLQQMKLNQEENDLIKEKDRRLAQARSNMNDSAVMKEQLETSASFVIKSFSKLSGGIHSTIKYLYEFLGKGIPKELELLGKQQQAIADVTDTELKLSDALKKRQETLNQIEALENKKTPGVDDQAEMAALKIIKKNVTDDIKDLNIRVQDKRKELNKIIADRQHLGLTTETSEQSLARDSGGTPLAGSATQSGGGSGSVAQISGGSTGLASIRDLIASVESIGGSYDTLFGNGTRVPLTSMTIAQVLQYQQDMIRRGAKSTAAGRYQFMSYTLPEYAKKAGFDFNTTLFNAATQDTLADILIREKGYDAFKGGKMSREKFLNNLSMAWAGLPSPAKGGRSYYGGDGLNKSHMSLDKAFAAIGQAKTGGIFSGPSTGYLTMLHGDEMVIPANDTITKQNLQNTVLNNSEDDEVMIAFFQMMNEQVEKIIDMVGAANRTQRLALKM
jgi:muramidase (phage lysozyme)